VPATSANLGPGFDSFGLALALYDDVEATVAEGGVSVEVHGEGAGEVPTDERHLVARAMLAAFARLGVPAPGLRLRCVNRIPQARGLGSSAAAIVAGVLAARALTPGGAALSDAAVVALAAELEGHADNVAACLLGGATIAWHEDTGFRAVRLEPAQNLGAYVFIPPHRSATAESRELLPPTIAHGDAAFVAGRAALLTHALTARPELLFAATEDRLHQRFRAEAMPESLRLVAQLRAAGEAAVLSGAGPTVLCLSGSGQPDDTVVNAALPGWSTRALELDHGGAIWR